MVQVAGTNSCISKRYPQNFIPPSELSTTLANFRNILLLKPLIYVEIIDIARKLVHLNMLNRDKTNLILLGVLLNLKLSAAVV